MEFDIEAIEKRGGNLCGADRFVMVCCSECRTHYLFNLELNDVYYDPQDLKRRFFKLSGMRLPPCAGCGALEWEFAPEALSEMEVQVGPWSWVLAY